MSLVIDDVLLNDVIDYNAISGGPEASTSIVTNPFSGVSQRNVNRLDQLHKYNINTALLTQQQLNDLRAFFHCRDGMGRAFYFKDMMEFWASPDGSAYDPIGTATSFGTGNGAETEFGLYKTYSSGGVTRTRRIVKPVSGTVSIYKNSVLQTLTTDYTIDYTTGIVTFAAAPTNGHALTWTGQFYVPVWFATDQFDPGQNDAITALSIGLPMIEVPASMFELSV